MNAIRWLLLRLAVGRAAYGGFLRDAAPRGARPAWCIAQIRFTAERERCRADFAAQSEWRTMQHLGPQIEKLRTANARLKERLRKSSSMVQRLKSEIERLKHGTEDQPCETNKTT